MVKRRWTLWQSRLIAHVWGRPGVQLAFVPPHIIESVMDWG